jgi:4,5-DOPA dioxygenase extradiol
LPWFVAAGAGGREHAPQRLHDSVTLGSLGMDAYAFGALAPRLVEQLGAAVGSSSVATQVPISHSVAS